jgi:hypothetical protein
MGLAERKTERCGSGKVWCQTGIETPAGCLHFDKA